MRESFSIVPARRFRKRESKKLIGDEPDRLLACKYKKPILARRLPKRAGQAVPESRGLRKMSLTHLLIHCWIVYPFRVSTQHFFDKDSKKFSIRLTVS
jgi:hypothetical protein